MVDTTETPEEIYVNGTPVGKADVRLWMNEVVNQVNAGNVSGDILTLSVSSGTAQNIVATIPASQVNIPLASLGRRIQFSWTTANTGADPTITIDGVVWTVKRRDGTALAANELGTGNRYLAVVTHTTNRTLRLLDAVAPSDIPSLPVALTYQTNASVEGDTVRFDTASGTAQSLVATVPASQAHIPLVVLNRRFQFSWQVNNTGANPTITVGSDVFTLKARDGSDLAANDLAGGVRYLGVLTHTTNKWIRVIEPLRMTDLNGFSEVEYRGTRVYASRNDAVNLITTHPIPVAIHRIFVLEGNKLVVRNRNRTEDALFPTSPLWGIESKLALDAGLDEPGTLTDPKLRGIAQVGRTLTADYGEDEGVSITWQYGDDPTGLVWTNDGFNSTYIPTSDKEGKYIRFRVRIGTTGNWNLSNVSDAVLPADTVVAGSLNAWLTGQGASRRYIPDQSPMVSKMAALNSGVAAGPPLDLYKDNAYDPGNGWLGNVTAPLPTEPCNLSTTYTPDYEVIHPCVVELYNEFCGYRYICAITGYPNGASGKEDPFIYGSHDRVNWSFLGGAEQPLAFKPNANSYNSDTFLSHDPRTGELIVGWRALEAINPELGEESPRDVVIRVRTTRDGYLWSDEVEIMRGAALDDIDLAPTMIFDPDTLTWHMWTINRPVMNHYYAPSLYGPWTKDVATVDISGFSTPHHAEIKWVGAQLVCLMYARANGNLYFGQFVEGSWTSINWNMTGVLNPRPSALYKASFVPIYDADAGTLAFDIWWTIGAAGPAGGVDPGFGRRLLHCQTNSVPI